MERASSSNSGAGRTAAIVIGAVLSLLAFAIVVAAAVLLIGMAVFDRDGFITSPSERLQGDAHALVSEPFDIEGIHELPSSEELRIRVSLDDADPAAFIGVAEASAVERALGDVSRATVTDGIGSADVGPVQEGGAPERPPGQLLDWEAQASGTGDLAVTWTPADGRWMLVVMNADGSRGIDVTARTGAEVPFLGAIGWTMLAVGALLGLLGAWLIALGARTRRHEAASAAAPALTDLSRQPTGGAPAPTGRPGALRVEALVPEQPSRGLWLIKWLLVIPHVLVLVVLWVAFVAVTVIAWFAIVITGRYPRGLWEFNAGVLRWSWRVSAYSYGALATDRYPPFSLADRPDYPARLTLEYPPRMSRALVFVKWILVFPHLLIIGAAGSGIIIGVADGEPEQLGLLSVLVLCLGVGLLFTGRLHGGLFDLIVGIQRWGYRVIAYVALLTDDYPPFRLDQGGEEPVRVPVGPAPPSGDGGSAIADRAPAERVQGQPVPHQPE